MLVILFYKIFSIFVCIVVENVYVSVWILIWIRYVCVVKFIKIVILRRGIGVFVF